MLKPKIVVNSDARYSDPVWGEIAAVPVREAIAGDVATPSPARSLQTKLETTLEMAATDAPRWSTRRSLAVISGLSVVGWALIALAVRALF